MAADTLFLGIDAGGSSCRARLADGSRFLGEAQVPGPSNARIGVDAVFERILDAARGAWRRSGLGPLDFARLRVGAGVSGIRRPGLLERFRERPHPFASLRWEDDAAIAALGAHAGREGGVVVAGTGSIAVGWAEGRRLRFGGYGFPGSDEGGGARLGLAAVEIAFLAADGRLDAGTLTRDLLARAQNDPQRLVAFCDQATPADYARLCPLVLHHAAGGDAQARELCADAGASLARLVGSLQRAGCPDVVLVGGLAASLSPYLPQGTALVEPLGDALDGALLLAGRPPTAMSGS